MATPTARGFSNPEETLFLVDVSSFIFRAFYAIRSLSNRRGEPTNAVYGVATMLKRLIDEAKPRHVVVVYDSKEPSVRKKVYEQYKANRSAPPDDLVPQFARIETLIQLLGMPSIRKSAIEADDLIATLADRWRRESGERQVVIVTGDKDLLQLVDSHVRVWDTMKEKIYGPDEVSEKMGVPPNQVRDYLAMVGDSSDNIPGVPSFGPKTAIDILKQFGSLDAAIEGAKSKTWTGKKADVLAANEELARLSAQLVELDRNVSLEGLPSGIEDFKYAFQVSDELKEFLKELDFHSLIERWSQSKSQATAAGHGTAPTPPPTSHEIESISRPQTPAPAAFRTVTDLETFQKVLGGIERTREFGFDLETTSLNARDAVIVGLAVCVSDDEAFYIPLKHRAEGDPLVGDQLSSEKVLADLKPFLENPKYKKIGQNLKFDWSILAQYGIQADGIGADTMVASYVLEPSGRHNLETLSLKYMDYKPMSFEEVCGKGKSAKTFDEISIEAATRYSAEDAWCTWKLWRTVKPEIEKLQLMTVFAQVDLPLVSILARMECEGVCLDSQWLKELSLKFQAELDEIEKKVASYSKKEINLHSTRQLAELLFEELGLPTQSKTKTGFSTDVTVLEALAPLHEVPRLLMEYREISKLKSTYVDPLPALVDPKTGRIHASFHQTVAATGRLSSSDPNLQNIPIRSARGQLIRKAFIPSEGHVLISADYSQIELRILAHMSGDPELIQSFRKGEDVHRRTAAEIFAVAPDQVTDGQRSIAKAINFGLMYGKTAFGLAQELGIPRAEAKSIIDRYFQRYSAVKRLIDGQVQQARERGWTETLLGRRRNLPELNSRNAMVRANAERMAMNSPIQGTAADLIKLAMIHLDDAIREEKLGARLTIQVHDELVLDCPIGELEKTIQVVRTAMEGAQKLDVPLVANIATGQNWMDL